ncbi:neuroblastoma breakpoint family member 6-like protein isoform X2 [Ochotona princeps]|uniref:neuroblastoma breakpoint family member 6-like protein isoform X2 n=1 Tax=Ochotona princeps TaxID=9978 RepID=UPI0027147B66|nr:neuroblastoma breakpoint family member 6-like protein isoform X2 [Ochotona princeps]XP_058516942.1 neuroblastoma breakpoint family member 6-like protein isoform X2 [Ochotona princeps]
MTATTISMAACSSAPTHPRIEMNLLEYQVLCSQLDNTQQELEDLKEKLLASEPTAYALDKQLQKHQRELCKVIMQPVLGENIQCEEEQLAESPAVTKRLREFKILLQPHTRQLRQ